MKQGSLLYCFHRMTDSNDRLFQANSDGRQALSHPLPLETNSRQTYTAGNDTLALSGAEPREREAFGIVSCPRGHGHVPKQQGGHAFDKSWPQDTALGRPNYS